MKITFPHPYYFPTTSPIIVFTLGVAYIFSKYRIALYVAKDIISFEEETLAINVYRISDNFIMK